MILRIVRLSFKPEEVPTFKQIFEASKQKIAASKGCHQVFLYQDVSKNNVFFTHSLWESEQALNNYRNSSFFRATWAKTKQLFNEKPLAWSLQKCDTNA